MKSFTKLTQKKLYRCANMEYIILYRVKVRRMAKRVTNINIPMNYLNWSIFGTFCCISAATIDFHTSYLRGIHK